MSGLDLFFELLAVSNLRLEVLSVGCCHLCAGRPLLPLLNFGEHPIAHHLLSDPSEEEYLHPVAVCFCENCGLIQLSDPVPPDRLYSEYNWLSSWKWNPHVPRLVRLIEELCSNLDRTANIVEVGSNDGSFLEVLRERGYRRVLGIEPARDALEASRQKGVETIGSYFTREAAKKIVAARGACDLFVSRQMLEHVSQLQEFREALSIILRPGGYVLVEVPNFEMGLAAPDYSIIWEEHVNYFTLETLTWFLAHAGVRPLHSETVTFSGEALVVLGEYVGASSSLGLGKCSEEHRAKALAYRDRWPRFKEALVDYLDSQRKGADKVAVYGAGCRACSLINFAGLGSYLEVCLDDQPEKQGKYMPGSRLPILPSKVLEEDSISLCLLAVNAENEEAVISRHQAYLKKGGRFASLHPPSNFLPPFWKNL